MQTAVSNTEINAKSRTRFPELSATSRYVSAGAAQRSLGHRRARLPLSLSWKFNLSATAVVTTVVAVSILVQA